MAFSYALIAWLVLQIADVVLEPLGAPAWVMRALIALVVAGFPVALGLAWFFELTPTGIERDQLSPEASRPTVGGVRRYADVVIIGVLALTVVFLLVRETGFLEPAGTQPVIGVLPFTELGHENGSYIGDGLADTLTYKLGRLKQLVVLAPSSTFEFRGQGLDLKTVGAKLNATALLEGTVRTGAGILRINTRLVDIGTGQQLWSGSFDRSSEDIFAVQDEIASAVTDALSVVLSLEDENLLAQDPTSSLTAYDAYLLGRQRLAQRRHETLPEATEYFRLAVERDPNYALAYASLAEALYLQTSYGHWQYDWSELGPKAHQAAATAVALDPALGEAYLAQALAAKGDNERGDGAPWPDGYVAALLKKAMELSPNNANVLKYYSPYAGPAEAVNLMQRAAQLDPRSAIIKHNIGEVYEDAGDYAQAQSWFIKAATAQDQPFLSAYKAIIEMHAYGSQQLDLGARWGRTAIQAFPADWRIELAAARVLLELGAWDELQQLLDRLPVEPESAGDRPFLWTQLIEGPRLALARGEFESAESQASEFTRLFLQSLETWPDLSGYSGPWTSALDIQAMAEMRSGQSATALARYRRLLPDPSRWYLGNFGNTALRTPVIVAVLKRLEGEPEEAEADLRQLLVDIAGRPLSGKPGIGFTRFTIHAFLGETDAAIAALEEATQAGWLAGWWSLKLGSFDPYYARVLEDPRFQAIYRDLENRVRQMREDYQANPELPPELRQQIT